MGGGVDGLFSTRRCSCSARRRAWRICSRCCRTDLPFSSSLAGKSIPPLRRRSGSAGLPESLRRSRLRDRRSAEPRSRLREQCSRLREQCSRLRERDGGRRLGSGERARGVGAPPQPRDLERERWEPSRLASGQSLRARLGAPGSPPCVDAGFFSPSGLLAAMCFLLPAFAETHGCFIGTRSPARASVGCFSASAEAMAAASLASRSLVLFLRLNTHSRATSHTTFSTTRVHTLPVHPVRRRRGPPAASGTVVRVLKAHACGRPAVGS